jgi:hypothetical protein
LGVSEQGDLESENPGFVYELDCYESSNFLFKDTLDRVPCILEVGDETINKPAVLKIKKIST